MNIAIVLAGGTGKRMGSDIPKQFLELDGRPVIAHSVEAFDCAEGVDETLIVAHRDWLQDTRELVSRYGWQKVRRVIEGGEERYLSSLNAIAALLDYPDDTNLLFHDAARPWVSQEVVGRVVDALRQHEAVAVGVPSTDTVWEVRQDLDGSRFVVRIPERRTMWLAQTPQAFRLPVIRDAYQRALQDPYFFVTDDCGVVRHYMPEVKIHIVEGEEANRKITYKEDLS